MLIKVLGPGCAKCKEAEKIVTAALQEASKECKVEKVTDFKEMMTLGVMSTPAVVIDGKVMCIGRVPSKAEVIGWLTASDEKISDSPSSTGCGSGSGC